MVKLGFAILLFVSAAARADVDAYFATGVLEVPWGSSLQQTKAAHPGGFAWPNRGHLEEGGYVYEVTGDFHPLGLSRTARNASFVFSVENKLRLVSIHFPYEDRDEILYAIAQVLGQNYEIRDEKNSRVFTWKPGRHADVALVISSNPSLPWAYLKVHRRQTKN